MEVGSIAQNYGEASAVNFLGQGLPFAISGHNNYFLWGPHGYTGEVMIVISGDSVEDLQKYYSDVQIAGEMNRDDPSHRRSARLNNTFAGLRPSRR